MTSVSPNSDDAAAAGALVDLACRGDVAVLLRRFYGRALFDELLAELRGRGMESHLPVMRDFEIYRGPVAERAKPQASRIALALSRRLTGDGSAGLNAAADFAASAAERLATRP